jgi:hypothetical protein
VIDHQANASQCDSAGDRRREARAGYHLDVDLSAPFARLSPSINTKFEPSFCYAEERCRFALQRDISRDADADLAGVNPMSANGPKPTFMSFMAACPL